jgi:hypothetical protein
MKSVQKQVAGLSEPSTQGRPGADLIVCNARITQGISRSRSVRVGGYEGPHLCRWVPTTRSWT